MSWPIRKIYFLYVGRLGSAAIVMTLICVAVVLFVVRPMEMQQRNLDDTLASLRQKQTLRAPLTKKRDSVRAFYDHFRQKGTLTDVLARIYAISQSENINIEKASYVLEHSDHLDLSKYSVDLTAKADYPDLKSFVLGVLEEVDTACIEGVTISRPDDTHGGVNVNIKLSIYESATEIADH